MERPLSMSPFEFPGFFTKVFLSCEGNLQNQPLYIRFSVILLEVEVLN